MICTLWLDAQYSRAGVLLYLTLLFASLTLTVSNCDVAMCVCLFVCFHIYLYIYVCEWVNCMRIQIRNFSLFKCMPFHTTLMQNIRFHFGSVITAIRKILIRDSSNGHICIYIEYWCRECKNIGLLMLFHWNSSSTIFRF